MVLRRKDGRLRCPVCGSDAVEDQSARRADPLPVGRVVRIVPQRRRGDAVNVYEVFLKKAGQGRVPPRRSLEAPDDEMAELYAREAYARRHEGDEMWLVDRRHLIVADRPTSASTTTSRTATTTAR